MMLPENVEAAEAKLALVPRDSDGTPDTGEKPYKLEAGPIIGITAACIVVLLAIIFGLACYKKKQRKTKERQRRKPIEDLELNSNEPVDLPGVGR